MNRRTSANEFRLEKCLTILFQHFLNLQNSDNDQNQALLRQFLKLLTSKFTINHSKKAPKKVFNGSLKQRMKMGCKEPKQKGVEEAESNMSA